ncbi:site-specific recombinase XerD [Rhizobium leucaenae]|uniref:Site-specific recombinase XerD n=1 Tax=Rhizobium leucaenae TaxID=29450 RepID=A0A7W6ZY38_9HYPH|nr:site-specific recombinase XerD [Rhizobium leucaenae]
MNFFPMVAGSLEQAFCACKCFHNLRHEAVSRVFERGLNVIEVSSISGHKELRTLKRYTVSAIFAAR